MVIVADTMKVRCGMVNGTKQKRLIQLLGFKARCLRSMRVDKLQEQSNSSVYIHSHLTELDLNIVTPDWGNFF